MSNINDLVYEGLWGGFKKVLKVGAVTGGVLAAGKAAGLAGSALNRYGQHLQGSQGGVLGTSFGRTDRSQAKLNRRGSVYNSLGKGLKSLDILGHASRINNRDINKRAEIIRKQREQQQQQEAANRRAAHQQAVANLQQQQAQQRAQQQVNQQATPSRP